MTLIAALAVGIGVGAAAFVSSATAKRSTVESQLHVVAVTEAEPADAVGFGYVTAAKEKCVPNRKVRLIIKFADGLKLFDTARTSANGGWEVRGDINEFQDYIGYVIKLAPRKVKAGSKVLKCGGDKILGGS